MSRRPRRFEVDKPDKLLWPEAGVSKRDLADYLEAVADLLLPWLRERPLSVVRAPDGVAEQVFVQKRRPEHAPDWLPGAEVASQDGELTMLRADHVTDLRWLADQACCGLHPWLSRLDRPQRPDRAIIDLDPSGDDFDPVRAAALDIRGRCGEADIPCFVMLTGGSGLHVVIPLRRTAEFDQVRNELDDFCARLVEGDPERFTREQRKHKRGDKIYLDIGRNAYAQTAIAPYSPRARTGAPVALPVRWDEVEDGSAQPGRWHLGNVRRRLAQVEDPWEDFRRRAIAPTSLARLYE